MARLVESGCPRGVEGDRIALCRPTDVFLRVEEGLAAWLARPLADFTLSAPGTRGLVNCRVTCESGFLGLARSRLAELGTGADGPATGA